MKDFIKYLPHRGNQECLSVRHISYIDIGFIIDRSYTHLISTGFQDLASLPNLDKNRKNTNIVMKIQKRGMEHEKMSQEFSMNEMSCYNEESPKYVFKPCIRV